MVFQAADLAMQRGWAINIGGGFHHAHSEGGGGFCVYADITLAIKLLMAKDPKVKKAMIIDLDAHQVYNLCITWKARQGIKYML